MPHPDTCSVDKCKRTYRAKGFCRVHYNKWRRGEMPKKGRYKLCGKENCRKPMYRLGICEEHYLQAAGKSVAAPAAAAVAEASAPEAPADSATS